MTTNLVAYPVTYHFPITFTEAVLAFLVVFLFMGFVFGFGARECWDWIVRKCKK